MDPPPPSQSQQTPRSTIFTNIDGTPIRVFTQADLLGRGKVLKELRLNGAELSSDATNAQIMLVDPSSRQGRLFIEDWGQDSDRTVLSSGWVKKSIAAGRPLLEGDQWGECLPQEADLPPIHGDADILDSNPAKSPLPTPRVTPEERSKMRPPTVHSKPSAVDVKSDANDLTLRQLPPSPIAAHTNPTDMAFQPQPQPGIPTMNPFMFMQHNNLQGPMMTLAQAMVANMMVPNFIPNQQQIPSDAFRLALQDSLRNQFIGWPGASAQPELSVENPPISQLQQPPLPYPIVPSISESKGESLPPSLEQLPSRRASASSEFTSENSMRKGKLKERAPSPSHKRRKILSSSAKVTKRYEGGTSKAGAPSQGTSVTNEARTLFTNDTGKPLRFYVQVDIHGRSNLVSMIKKNGGSIVGEAALADYAVLSVGNKRQKVYKSLLSAAASAGIPAIQARFISECISENALLDHAPFLFDSHPIRKRKRSMSTATTESKDDGQTILPEKKKQVTEMKTDAKKPVAREIPKISTRNSESHPKAFGGPRTPTPPLEHTREPWGAVGFKFSQAENDFALRYAKILIDRDYTISQNAVTAAIHEKLPHHSLASWRTHVTYIAREWETWRKHAAIAHRKAQSQKDAVVANVASALLEAEAETPADDFATLADLPNGKRIDPGDLEDDIKAAVQFFVEGNDNDETEDESSVWKRLAQRTPCKTAATWEMFYQSHASEVISRFNKALGKGRPT